MTLVQDAICTTFSKANFSEGRIHEDVLGDIIKNLDDEDIISIIFLMTDSDTNISQVINDIENDFQTAFKKLSRENNWKEKLLEILMIIKNFNVIRKLGYNKNEEAEMYSRFLIDVHSVTINLNRAIKSLYFLCKNLNKIETKKLIDEVYKDVDQCIKLEENKMWLELHILHWIKQKYITIDKDNINLYKLVKKLKNIGCLFPDFDYWRIESKTEQDSSNILENKDSLPNANNQHIDISDNYKISWRGDHKKLCIIINQINFNNAEKHKKRKGSECDAHNIKETFKGCGFKVIEKKDLTKKKMMVFLNSLNDLKEYTECGSIFIFILSHGYEGEVVFSDDVTIPIKTIRKKFCCRNLANVFKFLILQSCQGKKLGVVDTKLTTDSPLEIDEKNADSPLYCKHFGLFQATVDEFVAMRDEDNGSWFIEDICVVLKKSTKKMKITEFVNVVTDRLCARRGTYNNMLVAQVPETVLIMPIEYELPPFHKVCA